jgi:hypothetical protein
MVFCVFAGLKTEDFKAKTCAVRRRFSTVKTFADSEQFGVYFGHFRQLPLELFKRCNGGARPCPLFGGFEQKFSDLAAPQTLHQIIKRAMFESPLAAAVLFAARQVLFDIGRPQ